MEEIKNNPNNIAMCGLYCGACKKYLKGSCPGCKNNEKASWCKIRSCCLDNNYKSCADCKTYANPNDCKKFNNFIAKIIGFILRSDRKACIEMIKSKGYSNFAEYMTQNKLQTMKRK